MTVYAALIYLYINSEHMSLGPVELFHDDAQEGSIKLANTLWFGWRQNNSGGYDIKPGKYVFIEAYSKLEAIAIFDAEYYDDSEDCDCCGPRWDHEPDYENPKGCGLHTALEFVSTWALYQNYDTPVIFIRWYNGMTEALSWSKGDE